MPKDLIREMRKDIVKLALSKGKAFELVVSPKAKEFGITPEIFREALKEWEAPQRSKKQLRKVM
jgi:hypothetical protein